MTAPDRIAAVVLAAGLSRRFGGDKLLYPLRGRLLAAHIADTLAGVRIGYRLAVCPTGKGARAAIFEGRGYRIIANEAPELGMGHSLALAARRATELGAAALLVCLADMPDVTVEHLAALVAALGDDDAAVTEANGVRSPPAIFARSLFPRLAGLSGDKGAKGLLADAAVVAADPSLVRDYDTPADFD